jgi:stage II sporulation protein D
VIFVKKMLILILFLAGCAWSGEVGGALPFVLVEWGEREVSEVERYGDDRAILVREALEMLGAVGLSVEFEGERDGELTLGAAREIFLRVSPEDEELLVTDENSGLSVSYALWVDLVLRVVDEFETVDLIPFAQNEAHVITNAGNLDKAGVNFSPFFDMEMRVLKFEGTIFAVYGVVAEMPWLRGVFVVDSHLLGVTVYVGGVMRNYSWGEGVAPLYSGAGVVSLRVQGRRVVDVQAADAIISGTIERVADVLELREWGALPLCCGFAVYSVAESFVSLRGTDALLVGADMAEFYVINGRVTAAVILREVEPTFIRVVLGTSGFAGLSHQSVEITADGAFTVRGGERVARFSAGEIFRVAAGENDDFWGGLRFYIAPDSDESRLEIIGLRRNWADGLNPRYRGVFEISRHANGGFIIVNELCMEEYLYAVVPSEMPSSFGVEASMVQAVTARTFAYHQFYANRFRAYGAHVDDSVISQVYNNIPENDTSREAVRATRGMVLMYEGEIILANYFSTSGGTTANFGEVWASGGDFPSETPPFLRATSQVIDFELGDLRTEEAASAFFRNTAVQGIDAGFPWFRWNVHMTAAELTARVNAFHPIGELRYMEVLRRGTGGNIMEMIFYGAEGTARVQTEFQIRTVLNPRDIPVNRHDGSTSGRLNLLPSAFFTFDLHYESGVFLGATFYGGGNGHGVGMSQNGVRALLDKGLSYREILKHFYRGVEIVQR